MVVLFSATLAVAGQNGKRNGSENGDKDRLRDGSCLDQVTNHNADIILAADRDRDRLKDGSGDDCHCYYYCI